MQKHPVPTFHSRDLRPQFRQIGCLNPDEIYSRGILIRGMKGLGDNIYQRGFIRELKCQVYLETPWPELYQDLPHVHFVKFATSLRTQAKNLDRQPEHIWEKTPPGIPEIQVSYGARDLAVGSIQERMYNLFRVYPSSFELPPFPTPSFVKPGEKIAFLRPATVRSEWMNSARNPLPEYIVQAATLLREAGYKVISVCDLEPGKEWLVGDLPPADLRFHNGELSFPELMGLVQASTVLVGGVGWLLPAALGIRKPTLMIAGGNGGHNSPEKTVDPVFADGSNITWVLPEPYCRCANPKHNCSKTIVDFRGKCAKWIEKAGTGETKPLNFIPNESPFVEVGPDPTFTSLAKAGLIWLPEHGMGRFPIKGGDQIYDENYFQKYQGYAETEMGMQLTKARIAFVAKYYSGAMVDIGIGSGHFVQQRPITYGFDINPFGVKWLELHNLFVNPNLKKISSVSFWDSLEHIRNPKAILDNVQKWVFTSLPIFKNAEHILSSKHFRKDEHCWYWTQEGLIKWMLSHGFELKGTDDFETRLGREDIFTFAFKRREVVP